jgi:hypothetical protein
MSMPGFTAEASLSITTLHYHPDGTDHSHEASGVMPQQFEHPSFTISCSPCLLRYVPGSFQPWQWRESVRTCVYKEVPSQISAEGGYYVCGPCLEQRCSPFMPVDRFPLSFNLSP